ncbi:hypothetical protein BD770DRAFT_333721 [Pilaira anomala]|nr:hypothetical protein BD770DRAFT_333721 [Pilaira anomala]
MQSIVSTFVGLLFPHTLQVDEENNQVYFLLYEAYFGVKITSSKIIIKDSFKRKNSLWNLNTLKYKTDPILLVATGSMDQQATISGFLGRAVEEKFHLAVITLQVMPCIPLVSENLKNMVHPSIGPVNLSRGVREGYFYVNMSLKQNFENGPEFYASHAEGEELDDFEREILNRDRRTAPNVYNDEDEIVDNKTSNDRDVFNNGDESNKNKGEDFPVFPNNDEYLNTRRFSDSSMQSWDAEMFRSPSPERMRRNILKSKKAEENTLKSKKKKKKKKWIQLINIWTK